MRNALLISLPVILAACVGGVEDTHTFVRSKSASQTVIGIHISLMNHPRHEHVIGYNKMQSLAEATCAEFGKSSAKYTGKQERKSAGSAYDTWIERTYRCQ